MDRRTAYYLWADALYRIGRSAEDAYAAYTEAAAAYPDGPETPWGLYQARKLAARMGRTAEAARLGAELESRFPDDTWTLRARSRLGPAVAQAGESR